MSTEGYLGGNPYPKMPESVIKKAEDYYNTKTRANTYKEDTKDPVRDTLEAKRAHARALVEAKMVPEEESVDEPTEEELRERRRLIREENIRRKKAAEEERLRREEQERKDRAERLRTRATEWYNFAATLADKNPAYARCTGFNSVGRTLNYRKKHALIVGISAYDSPVWQENMNGVDDAHALKSLLLTRGFEEGDIEMLLDRRAQKNHIMRAMDRLVERTRARPDDLVVMAFFCHSGSMTLTGGASNGFIVPWDCVTMLEKHFILGEYIDEMMLKMVPRHILQISYNRLGGKPLDKKTTPQPMKTDEGKLSEIRGHLESRSRLAIMTGKNENTVEFGPGVSPFLKALRNTILRGVPTTMQVVKFIKDNLHNQQCDYGLKEPLEINCLPGHVRADSFWTGVLIKSSD